MSVLSRVLQPPAVVVARLFLLVAVSFRPGTQMQRADLPRTRAPQAPGTACLSQPHLTSAMAWTSWNLPRGEPAPQIQPTWPLHLVEILAWPPSVSHRPAGAERGVAQFCRVLPRTRTEMLELAGCPVLQAQLAHSVLGFHSHTRLWLLTRNHVSFLLGLPRVPRVPRNPLLCSVLCLESAARAAGAEVPQVTEAPEGGSATPPDKAHRASWCTTAPGGGHCVPELLTSQATPRTSACLPPPAGA
nr:uncharacterized protein LOC116277146 [Vicugna pacos]